MVSGAYFSFYIRPQNLAKSADVRPTIRSVWCLRLGIEIERIKPGCSTEQPSRAHASDTRIRNNAPGRYDKPPATGKVRWARLPALPNDHEFCFPGSVDGALAEGLDVRRVVATALRIVRLRQAQLPR
jgi:hypothetical protein